MEKAGRYHLSEVTKVNINTNKTNQTRNFLVVQWRRLCASTAGDTGLITSWKTEIPQATLCGQPKKKKTSQMDVPHNWI